MTIDDAGADVGPPASSSSSSAGAGPPDDGAPLTVEAATGMPHEPRPTGSDDVLATRDPLAGPWRVEVAERSMVPAIEPGDWLLVDPTVRTWPRRGAIVVFREPGSDLLAIKRVAARTGDTVVTPDGSRHRLAVDEAWLLGDAPGSHDSRHYGPVALDRLRARAWFRYGPPGRVGLLAGAPGSVALRRLSGRG